MTVSEKCAVAVLVRAVKTNQTSVSNAPRMWTKIVRILRSLHEPVLAWQVFTRMKILHACHAMWAAKPASGVPETAHLAISTRTDLVIKLSTECSNAWPASNLSLSIKCLATTTSLIRLTLKRSPLISDSKSVKKNISNYAFKRQLTLPSVKCAWGTPNSKITLSPILSWCYCLRRRCASARKGTSRWTKDVNNANSPA